jgi:hypothetical protein
LGAASLSGTPEAIAIIKEITAQYFGDENAISHQGYEKYYPKGRYLLAQAIREGAIRSMSRSRKDTYPELPHAECRPDQKPKVTTASTGHHVHGHS